jgi:hypothetical protein
MPDSQSGSDPSAWRRSSCTKPDRYGRKTLRRPTAKRRPRELMRVSAVERPHAAWRCLGLVLVPLLAACATAFEAPPSPAAVQAVRVGPTVDQSGKLPLLRGDTVLGRLFRIRKITVGEALADDAGRFLRKRGFVVATTREASAAPVLRFEVRRWDEEPPSTPAVTVSVVPHSRGALDRRVSRLADSNAGCPDRIRGARSSRAVRGTRAARQLEDSTDSLRTGRFTVSP